MKKNLFSSIIILLVIVFAFSGCVEPRYYRENHHHSPEYEQRHHPVNVRGGVQLDLHN